MATTLDSKKSVRLPTFDGKKENYQYWWWCFKSYAGMYGFAACLKTTAETHLPNTEDEVLDGESTQGKQKINARRRNQAAIANLSLSFDSEQLMSFVYRSVTAEFPGGLAWRVVEALEKKYRPADTMSKVHLRQEMVKVSMKTGEDPATIFNQLCKLENMYKVAILEEDKIAIVISAVQMSTR